MNILLIGGTSSLINHLILKLRKEGYRVFLLTGKYSLQGTTQGRYLTGGVPPVRFSM